MPHSKYVWIAFCTLCSIQAIAKDVDHPKIKTIAQTKLAELNRKKQTKYTMVKDAQIYYDHGQKMAYVQKIEPTGFIVISADDALPPILGYSLTHDFSWDDHPDNQLYHLVKNDVTIRKQLAMKKSADDKSKIARKWELLSAGIPESTAADQTVWPQPGTTDTEGWVVTLWHQGEPFNACCPYDDINHGRSIVGCTATAMAQLVNYYGAPADLGDFSDADDYTSVYNDFEFDIDDDCGSNGTLTWDQLNSALNNITYPVPDGSSAGLVDELSYACGVSIYTKYSATASSANPALVATVLKDKFGYLSAEWKESTETDFFTVLKANMKNGQPAEMSIYSSTSGHAIVVDGFDEVSSGSDDDLYHLNYGWGSQSYCYWWNLLPYDNVDPELPSGYTLIGGAIVNISPGYQFIVENVGYADLTITSITDDKTWLQITPSQSLPVTLPPTAQLQINASVTDWSSVTYPSESATISVYSNDPDAEKVPYLVTVIAHPLQVPPPAPSLANPANGATEQQTTIALVWQASSGATSYRLQVDDASDFADPAYDQSGLTLTTQQVSDLANNTTYYWRVNATNGMGTSSWSSVWHFTTAGLAGNLGDTNGDNSFNSTDALIALSCDVGIDVSSFCPMNCGDVNADGEVNSTDALIILSYDVGMEVTFPIGEAGCPTNVTTCSGCNP